MKRNRKVCAKCGSGVYTPASTGDGRKCYDCHSEEVVDAKDYTGPKYNRPAVNNPRSAQRSRRNTPRGSWRDF